MSQAQNQVIEPNLAGCEMKIHLDYLNERIKVLSYSIENIEILSKYLNILASGNTFGKIIISAREEEWQRFLSHGYVLEAVNKGYFSGRPCYYVVKFTKNQRNYSPALVEEDKILEQILKKPLHYRSIPLPSGFIIRNAESKDIPRLSKLYNQIFASYPSAITEPEYLNKLIKSNFFKVVLYQDEIVSAASLEINHEFLSAEMTDCLCLPEFEGQGLMYRLIYSLEQDAKKIGLKNLYSIARATSPGINAVLKKLGYAYGGRLINNCTICGGFENMNLWTKAC